LKNGWTVPIPENQFTDAATCDYVLTATEGKTIKLEFTEFKVGEQSSDCRDDYVQVGNSAEFVNDNYKKCGPSVSEQPPVSKSNKLYVKLVAGQTNAAKIKFVATVSEVAAETGRDANCGDPEFDVSTLKNGWTVPITNKPFTGAATCDYVLTAAEGKQVKLEFTEFKVGPETETCTEDYVQVGNSADFANDNYKKCGPSVSEQPPVSKSNKLYVKLVAGQTNAAKIKFVASVTEVTTETTRDPGCGDSQLEVSSLKNGWTVPIPENQFTDAATCDYVLTATEGKTIKLEFTEFKVGAQSSDCRDDYVQVGNSAEFVNDNYKKCGPSVSEQPPVSKSNKLYVKLVAGQTNAAKIKFVATVTEVLFADIVLTSSFRNRLLPIQMLLIVATYVV
uniref:CUB domain-containing protein n=1 Tax=Echinostoma caproni TaxID=27848 RepID=A0A183AE57_9TREM